MCGFTHLPDRADDERQRNRRRVSMLTDTAPNAKFLLPLDVTKDEDIRPVMRACGEEFGKIDFLLHSVAYRAAGRSEGRHDRHQPRRVQAGDGDQRLQSDGRGQCGAKDILAPKRASIVTMTYFGGEKAVPGYNVMGICKAALDSVVKYLAYDLGPRGVRVNAVSAGPVRTLAGRAAGVEDMLGLYEKMAPLGTQHHARRGGPHRRLFACPTCRTASPAKSCTSIAATTSWARPAGCWMATSKAQGPPVKRLIFS